MRAFYSQGSRAEIGFLKECVNRGLQTEERATIADAYFGRVPDEGQTPLGLHIVVGCESGVVGVAKYTEMKIIDEVMYAARASRMEELIGKTLTAYVTTAFGTQEGGYVVAIELDEDRSLH